MGGESSSDTIEYTFLCGSHCSISLIFVVCTASSPFPHTPVGFTVLSWLAANAQRSDYLDPLLPKYWH